MHQVIPLDPPLHLPLHYGGLPNVCYVYFVTNYHINRQLGSLSNLAGNSNEKKTQAQGIKQMISPSLKFKFEEG